MHIALWVVAGLLAVAFLGAGLLKLTQSPKALAAKGMAYAEDFPPVGLKAIGAAEVAGALGLVLPALLTIAPVLVPVAAAALAVVMAGAVVVHLRRKEASAVVAPLVLGLLAVFVAWGRFGPYAF